MSILEIPRAVLDKAVQAAPLGDEATAIIEAAWPFLYALALRHAAQELVEAKSPMTCSCDYDLRDMADEAAR